MISSCHHTRGETAGQQAKGPTVQSSAHQRLYMFCYIHALIQRNAPNSHQFHQLKDGFGKQNKYDRGKESSHAAVCRSVCENPDSVLLPLKIFEQLSQKKHHQGLKSF